MSQGEFSLIEEYFTRQARSIQKAGVILGIGDDAAVLKVPEFHQLVVTMDTLIADHHFPLNTQPGDIAYKSLAVNVSDLAAMAASPFYFVLSLSLPEADESFLQDFSRGLFAAAREFDIALVGGDTCKGPLSITIQASGLVPDDAYISRSGAKPGDRIFVSGELGTAALGLASIQGKIALEDKLLQRCLQSLNRPRPRLDLIPFIREFATAAIDVSDGLVADLGHILDSSESGAMLEKSQLPVCDWIRQQQLYDYALGGGDDYELLFTVPQKQVESFRSHAQQVGITVSEIGRILPVSEGYRMRDQSDLIEMNYFQGFNHFANA